MSLVISNDRNDVVCSPLLNEVTIETLTSLPTLPFDLIPDILIRLPVKLLLQFRCVCKSWKSLISDPTFAKKHLSLSTTYSLHCISYSRSDRKYSLQSYSHDSSVFTDILNSPDSRVYLVGSCNGILCLAAEYVDLLLIRLWNPSIRKFKELPPIIKPYNFETWMHGFRYDPISDNYKVVVVLHQSDDNTFSENEVKVHTLGTNSWKSVSVFPFAGVDVQPSGQYASGTINWLVSTVTEQSQSFIASFDLGNECYQEVLLPVDFCEADKYTLLSVFRDCLCMISGGNVWVMKEYGNKESWTKLFTISYMRDPCVPSHSSILALYVFEDDDHVLLTYIGYDWRWKYISYNCKNNTSKFIELENTPKVYVESLISFYF